MPKYKYQCSNCNHQFSKFLLMERMKEPEKNPCSECKKIEVKQVLNKAPSIGDPVRLGILKPDNDFRKYVLDRIKQKNPGSTIESGADREL